MKAKVMRSLAGGVDRFPRAADETISGVAHVPTKAAALDVRKRRRLIGESLFISRIPF
jgi:hypothetical protein